MDNDKQVIRSYEETEIPYYLLISIPTNMGEEVIGASGMGAYHGHDGFLEFSHSRAVYTQVKGDLLAVIRPPYGDKFRQLFSKRLK